MRVFLLFDCERFVLVCMSEGRKEGCAPLFERELATAGGSGPPFFGGERLGRNMLKLVLALAFLFVKKSDKHW